MAKVTDDKQEARSRRLLKLIIGKHALIEQIANHELMLIKIKGERTIKCPRAIMANWLSSGLVVLAANKDQQCITVTSNGKSFIDRVTFSDLSAQHLAPEIAQIDYEGEQVAVSMARNESPLARLAKSAKNGTKSWLEGVEYEAGERLRMDFEYAHMGPKVTALWDPTATLSASKGGRRPSETRSERAMAARKRFNNALEAVGPEMAGLLIDVCCYLKGLEQVEFERQWPRRSAKLLLKTALAVLARHYAPPRPANRQNLRHWGSQNYRPEI